MASFEMSKIPSVHTHSQKLSDDVDRPEMDLDEAQLALFGKKQQLKRRFGFISVVGLSCTLMITWEGILMVLSQTLSLGGPQGAIYAFIFSWIGVTAQTLVMAELVSMIPLAGGQYNWVAVLAPPKYSRLLSFLTGWVTAIAWQTVTAASVYLVGTITQGLVQLNYPETYHPTQWQTTLILLAVIAVALVINTFLAWLLPQIESWTLALHVFGFVAILIPLAYLGPKTDAHNVFETFIDLGGWSSNGLAFFIGLNTTLLCFIGIDGAAHMAEEIENASVVIPRALVVAVFINGALGFAMLIAALFSIVDLDATLSTPTGYPFMAIFTSVSGSSGSATGMAIPILLAMISTAFGALATSSRMLWAFARERGVPGHRWISEIHTSARLPLTAIGVTVLINVLLVLINLGSAAAFNAFTSLAVAAFYISFLLSASCLLWRKFSPAPLRYGPWTLGRWSVPVTIFSMCFSIIGAFFSFWPTMAHPDLVHMNWAALVFGGVIFLSLVYWVTIARKSYTGPVVELMTEEMNEAELRWNEYKVNR